jgi:mediator of DNA damage checkpoint protein 1
MGEAREYLKKLLDAVGATFTPTMTAKNTHIIAA